MKNISKITQKISGQRQFAEVRLQCLQQSFLQCPQLVPVQAQLPQSNQRAQSSGQLAELVLLEVEFAKGMGKTEKGILGDLDEGVGGKVQFGQGLHRAKGLFADRDDLQRERVQ